MGGTPVVRVWLSSIGDHMKSTLFALLAMMCLAPAITRADDLKPADNEDGFKSLFNGKDLAGWDGDPDHWSAADGMIVGQTTKEKPAKHNTFLIARDGDKDLLVGDFEFRVSFRFDKDHDFGNSGIQ